MAYGNPPDLSPGGNLPVCNNEKPAESGETALLYPFHLNEHNNEALSVLQITIRSSLKIIVDHRFYLNMKLLQGYLMPLNVRQEALLCTDFSVFVLELKANEYVRASV